MTRKLIEIGWVPRNNTKIIPQPLRNTIITDSKPDQNSNHRSTTFFNKNLFNTDNDNFKIVTKNEECTVAIKDKGKVFEDGLRARDMNIEYEPKDYSQVSNVKMTIRKLKELCNKKNKNNDKTKNNRKKNLIQGKVL